MSDGVYSSDTIIALSTPPGHGGIAVLRLSGSSALPIAKQIFSQANKITPRTVVHGFINEPGNGQTIDEVVLTYYVSPSSYTGEDMIEINCHGSPFITERITELCLQIGARPADPGEFTKRAFLNGKMDLSQAEAIADLIYARTQSAHRTSLEMLAGKIGHRIHGIHDDLIDLTSLLELELDFAEDEITFTSKGAIQDKIHQLIKKCDQLIESYRFGRIAREGLRVPIIGPTNAGKSSLFNALLEEERVIVSPHPGTTRDSIEEAYRLGGYLFRLTDTAGLRDSHDDVENMGMRRTQKHAAEADIVLRIIDLSDENVDREQIRSFKKPQILVLNKIDLLTENEVEAKTAQYKDFQICLCSAKERVGIHAVAQKLLATVKSIYPATTETPITRKRHVALLQQARAALHDALLSHQKGNPAEIVSVDLRNALAKIDEILGKSTSDEILNHIFNHFCIGK